MKSIRLATAAAVVTGLFAASSEAATTEWWNIDFSEVDDIVALTNDTDQAVHDWRALGVWTTVDSDESAIIAAGDEKYQNESAALKLDTQGAELQWSLKGNPPLEGAKKTLIDADMCLGGAEEDPKDFDNGDVQAAIYLRSITDEDNNTTNNLRVYTYDGDLRTNIWVTLFGVEVADSTWHHVQVSVDYSGSIGMVSVTVDGTLMADADGATSWTIANNLTETKKISSVSFKGTGAVDNFVGAVEAGSSVSYLFTGATFLDGASYADVPAWDAPNAASPVGTAAQFTTDTVLWDAGDLAATLSSVTIVTFDAEGGTNETSYAFTYDEGTEELSGPAEAPQGLFEVDNVTGAVTINAPTDYASAETDGAAIEIVKVYYTSVGGGDEPIEAVEPGDGLTAADGLPVEALAAGSELDGEPVADDTFVVRFVGQAGVTYQLIAVDALDDDWSSATLVPGSVTCSNTGDVITLTATMDEDAQFYKIKATK